MNKKSLDDILYGNDEPEVVEAVEQPQEPEPQGVEPEPVQEPEAGPPPADRLPQDVYEPLKAVRSENKELKDQLEALRREIQQPKEPPAPPPSVWEDENAWGWSTCQSGGAGIGVSVEAANV